MSLQFARGVPGAPRRPRDLTHSSLRKTPLTLLVFLCFVVSARAIDRYIIASTSMIGKTPDTIGVGFSGVSEGSNALQWLDYVGCNGVRSFVQASVTSWRSKMKGTFGKSVTSGLPVTTLEEYNAAVAFMRIQGRKGDFLKWLTSGKSPRGSDWKRYLLQAGRLRVKSNFFEKLQERGLRVIGLWDFRCRSLRMETFLNNKAEYWMERYEETLLFYIGGHLFSEWGIQDVEVYNEPDLDRKKYGCIDIHRFKDLLRIRSQAIRAAYEDRHSRAMIHVGSFTSGWDPVFSDVVANNMRTPFPEPGAFDHIDHLKGGGSGSKPYLDAEVSPLGEYYALHYYGFFSPKNCSEFGPKCRNENGYSVAKHANRAKSRLRERRIKDLEISVTEFNCFTASQSDMSGHDYFEGKNVVDYGATAACLASQFSGFNKQGRNKNYKLVNVHKFMQTKNRRMPSGLAKNGLTFAEFHPGKSLDESVKNLGGISRTGMALRQICTKAGFGNNVYGFNSGGKDINGKKSRFNVWTVRRGEVAHIFVINDNWESTNALIDVNQLIDGTNQPYWVTEISDDAFAEVTQRSDTGERGDLYLDVPISIFKIITLPMVPSHWETVEAVKDAEIGHDSYRPGNAAVMRINTNGTDTSIAMMKFDTGDRKIVGANLELTLDHSTNDRPQVLTVVAWNRDWDEGFSSWNGVPFLKKNLGDTSRVSGNFLNWEQVEIVGYITVPANAKSGQKVSLDVSDWINRVSNFAIMRLVRHDASPNSGSNQTPQDEIKGAYFFHSREADNPDHRPKLFVAVKNS